MPDQHIVFKLGRGITAAVNSYAGPSGELIVDSTKGELVLQNGSAGGVRLANKSDIKSYAKYAASVPAAVPSDLADGGLLITPAGGSSVGSKIYQNQNGQFVELVIGEAASVAAVPWVSYAATLPATPPSDMPEGGLLIVGSDIYQNQNDVLTAVVGEYTGTAPITVSGRAISHATSGVTAGSYGPSSNTSPGSAGTFSVPYLTVDAKGHVTACSSKTITMPTVSSTSYTGTSPITVSGTTISHATSGVTAGSYGPSSNTSPGSAGTFSVPYITVDNKGHVTACSSKTITMPTVPSTSSFVTLSTAQTITAVKTFSNAVPIITGTSEGILRIANTSVTKGTGVTANLGSIHFCTNGSSASGNYVFGLLQSAYTSAKQVDLRLRVYSGASGSSYKEISLTNGAASSTFGSATCLHPGSDNDVYLGYTSYRWKQLYAGSTTISTSDRRLKRDITAISDELLDEWAQVSWQQFRMTDAYAEKGDEARYHFGLVAQDLQTLIPDARRFGFFCYDSWPAEEARYDSEGNVDVPARPAGDAYSLRYTEALCLEAAYQRRRADRMEARLAALETRLAALEVKVGD